jgi:hypothetical protein
VEVPVAIGEHSVDESVDHSVVDHSVGHAGDHGVVATNNGDANGDANGATMMAFGRVSIAREIKPLPPTTPFTPVQLAKLDEAIALSTRSTGLAFSIYLGELGVDSREQAERLHASVGRAEAADSVLIAVSPGQRVVEVVTGDESHRRLSDRACKLAVMSMVASFKEGDLIGGLVSALRMLTDQAGRAPQHIDPATPSGPSH